RHTRFSRDWSSDVCSSDLVCAGGGGDELGQMLGTQPQRDHVLRRARRQKLFDGWVGLVDGCEGADSDEGPELVDEAHLVGLEDEIGRASCREREWTARGAD